MFRTAAFLTALAALLLMLHDAASAWKPGPMEEKKVIVGKEGMKLYPRLNRSLKPLAELDEGKTVLVLRELRAWMQVQVEESELKGWIVGDVKKTRADVERKYDTIADPATTGLVARGWSARYAASHGADFSKVKGIEQRSIDSKDLDRFLQGEVLR